MFKPSAKIIADSINESGDRLTTFVLTYHRFIHSEFMTHRMLCLAGDTKIFFDLPSALNEDSKRVYSMTIKEFVEKWTEGSKDRPNKKKREFDFSAINPEEIYDSKQLCLVLNALEYYHNLNANCRAGQVKAYKQGKKWMVKAQDFIDFVGRTGTNKQKNLQRLAQMNIRQVNEVTGEVQHATVKDCCFSGVKQVFKLIAGKFSVRASGDHLILTKNGWKKIKDIICEKDFVATVTPRKEEEQKLNPLRLKKINGEWTCKWNKIQRDKLTAIHGGCEICNSTQRLEVHHIVPVSQDESLAFDESNVQLLCQKCHKEAHKKQGWQKGNPLSRNWIKVESIVPDGIEETYDLEINGEFSNFLANNIVVHNSKNSSSSRAIPVEKMIKLVEEQDVYPLHWGKNQKGMIADQELSGHDQVLAEYIWRDARILAIRQARLLTGIDIHKQIVNRLLEPFSTITVICSGTEYQNFFEQRCHPDAQPEMQALAIAMKTEYDASKPKLIRHDDPVPYHLPLIDEEDWLAWDENDLTTKQLLKVATGRCGRVSYLNHDGVRILSDDIKLHDRLLSSKPAHLSPFEHCAIAMPNSDRYANFTGWQSYRNILEGEAKECL